MLLLLACTGPLSSEVVEVPDTDTDDSGTPDTTVEHCGMVEADEVWDASTAHLVSCDVKVDAGTLTIEPNTTVHFAAKAGLTIGNDNRTAGLVVDGASGGITFAADSGDGWDGLTIGSFAEGVSIAGLSLRDATGGVVIDVAEVAVVGLAISGAEEAGLTLKNGAALAYGSQGLVVTECGGYAVQAEVETADSLPSAGSSYTGNAEEGVWLEGDTLSAAVVWEDLGVPYILADTVDVRGTAESPAVLTLGAGVSLLFDNDRGLRFSRSGDASQLIANGTPEAPITFAGLGAQTAGYWRGIEVASGASEIQLRSVRIDGAGQEKGSALEVADVDLLVDDVVITGSAGTGILLDGGARFAEGSNALAVSGCEVPLALPPGAVAGLPLDGLEIRDNSVAAVQIAGDGAVEESGTWPDLGVPYWVADDVSVNGTADDPAVLTIAEGVTLLFDNDTGIFVGKEGAAGLLVQGVEGAPVLMEPWSAYVAGAWSGIGIYDEAVDGSVVLSWVDIGFAGGATLKGNVHVADASPALSNVSLHDSLEWGLYLSGDSVPLLDTVSYADNAGGDCNLCE